jgi:hypothetical protein
MVGLEVYLYELGHEVLREAAPYAPEDLVAPV